MRLGASVMWRPGGQGSGREATTGPSRQFAVPPADKRIPLAGAATDTLLGTWPSSQPG